MERVKSSGGGEVMNREVPLHSAFQHNQYEVKRRLFRSGSTYDVSDGQGNFLMRARRESFHLIDKFHLYEDKAKEKELLSFKTRGSIPKTYDIEDPAGAEKIGSIRHNLSHSLLRTNWDILSPEGEIMGTLRRSKITKSWHRNGPKMLFSPNFEIVTPDQQVIATLQKRFSLTGLKLDLDLKDPNPPIDRRLLVAANIIMAEREFRESKQ